MTKIPDSLKPQVAEAAFALRGHLEMLGRLGVTGLPVIPRRESAPVTAPAPAPKVAVPTPPAPAPAEKPAASPPPSTGGMPWERHLPTSASAVPKPLPVEKPVTVSAPPVVTPPLAPPRADTVPGAAGLKIIQDDLGDCRRCRLWSGRQKIVFGVGNPQADIVFVGEGPGADEDLQGEPFVGKAGQLLTQMIKAMGLEREQVYICNVVKCRPPNNRDPEPDEVAACSPFLDRQLATVKPKIIVTLGRVAAHHLLKNKAPISRIRGTWHEYDGVPVMPTFHPSYLLRDPTQKKYAWEDLKNVLHKLGRPVPETRKSTK